MDVPISAQMFNSRHGNKATRAPSPVYTLDVSPSFSVSGNVCSGCIEDGDF